MSRYTTLEDIMRERQPKHNHGERLKGNDVPPAAITAGGRTAPQITREAKAVVERVLKLVRLTDMHNLEFCVRGQVQAMQGGPVPDAIAARAALISLAIQENMSAKLLTDVVAGVVFRLSYADARTR